MTRTAGRGPQPGAVDEVDGVDIAGLPGEGAVQVDDIEATAVPAEPARAAGGEDLVAEKLGRPAGDGDRRPLRRRVVAQFGGGLGGDQGDLLAALQSAPGDLVVDPALAVAQGEAVRDQGDLHRRAFGFPGAAASRSRVPMQIQARVLTE